MQNDDFWVFYDIAPLCLLAECMYHNECQHGVSWGDDCCDYVDADSLDESHPCETCEKSEEKYLYYPSITDDILINLLLICGTDGLDLKVYCTEEDRDKILSFVLNKSEGEIKQNVRDYLIGVEQEYGRM